MTRTLSHRLALLFAVNAPGLARLGLGLHPAISVGIGLVSGHPVTVMSVSLSVSLV
jgi:hypothetical protein